MYFLVLTLGWAPQMISPILKINPCFCPKDLKNRAAIGKLRPSVQEWGEGISGASLKPWAAPEESPEIARKGKSSAAKASLGDDLGPLRKGNQPLLHENTPLSRVTHLHQNTFCTRNWSLQKERPVFFISWILIKIRVLPYPISFSKIGSHLPASCLTKTYL